MDRLRYASLMAYAIGRDIVKFSPMNFALVIIYITCATTNMLGEPTFGTKVFGTVCASIVAMFFFNRCIEEVIEGLDREHLQESKRKERE